MFMTFEKIEPKAEVEHPAYRAARMIKELHQENIKKMDEGFVFLRDGVDINDEMRQASQEQIEQCDEIMEKSKNMDPKFWEPATLILGELTDTVKQAEAEERTLAASIPEIGNYDHD